MDTAFCFFTPSICSLKMNAGRRDSCPSAKSLPPPPPKQNVDLLALAPLLKGRWKITRKLGQGAFGEIYAGREVTSNKLVAIKIERANSKKQVLKLEVAVLKKLQTCPWVVQFITCGRHSEFNYMVMELLGDNLSELRRKVPNGKFSLSTTCKLGMHMLRAIEAVHELGFLHRDVKPSNFAIGLTPDKKKTAYVIDFGLARKYLLPNGDVRPPRDQAGFRGTARYASINSHDSKDLSRRDDIWSIFYVIVEFYTGGLPWRRIKDKDAVGEMKKKYNAPCICDGCPPEFKLWLDHLNSLSYQDRPNYKYLSNTLADLLHKEDEDENSVFDWEKLPNESSSIKDRPRPVPTLTDLALLKLATNFDEIPKKSKKNVKSLPQKFKKPLMDFWIKTRSLNLDIIAELMFDKNLKGLDLSKMEVSESDVVDLQIFSKCKNLKNLTLPNCTDQFLKSLFGPSLRSSNNSQKLENLTLLCSPKLTSKSLKIFTETLSGIKCLSLLNSEKLNDKHLELILKTCSNLKQLSVSGCKKIKGTAFKSYVANLSNGAKQKLKSLDLSHCEINKKGFKLFGKLTRNLKELKLTPFCPSYKITTPEFVSALTKASQLVTFRICNYQLEMEMILVEISKKCLQLNNLSVEGLSVTDFGLQSALSVLGSKLNSLEFKYGDGVTEQSLFNVATHCSTLKVLKIEFWNKFNQLAVSDSGIRKVLDSCKQLKEFVLDNCTVMTANSFCENGFYQNLIYLNLSECVQLNDLAIQRIVGSCPSLKILTLSNLNNLTENSLQDIKKNCRLLEKLILIDCSCFTDDMIKRLLAKNPKLFIEVTRYSDNDLKGVVKEIHTSTVQQVFAKYPNTFREKAYEKTRKRLFGL